VRRSYNMPAETFDINVTGTANVLETAREIKGKCTIVVITTDKVYENKEQDILYIENDSLGGYDPYSASKACTELVVSSFRTSFFHPGVYESHQKAVTSVRAGNVIGGGDWSEDRIIPDIIRSLKNEETITVRNPSAVRPWQHVLEPIGAYLVLAAKLDKDPGKFSKPYNVGPLPNDHLTVKELVKKSIQVWGSGSWTNPTLTQQPHEAGLLKLSIDRIQKELGWKPRLNADTAIEWTINWYKQPQDQQLNFTFEQVRKYFGS
jgi:CDP-glucose 4,6-dehydratase